MTSSVAPPYARWTRWVTWLVLLGVALLAARGQINRGLGRMQTPGQPAYSMSSAVSVFSPVASQRQLRCAWATWHLYPAETPPAADASAMGDCQDQVARCSAGGHPACGDGTAHRLIDAYVVLHVLVVLVVLLVLWLLWRRGRKELVKRSDSYYGAVRRLTSGWVIGAFAGLWVLSSIAALFAEAYLGRQNATPGGLDTAAGVLAWVPLGTWLASASLGVLSLLLWLDPWFCEGSIAPERKREAHAWRRAVGLMREEILLVALLGVVLLLPALDQVQDVILRWADGGRALVAAPLTAVTLAAFGLMIWRSAYRGPLTEYRPFKPFQAYVPLVLAGMLVVLGFTALHRLLGIGVIILVLGILTWVVDETTGLRAAIRRLLRRSDAADGVGGRVGAEAAYDAATVRAGTPDRILRERVLRLARLLAVAPLAFLGLAILRATVLPLLVPRLFSDLGTLLLCVGGLVLIVLTPMAAAVLRHQDGPALEPGYQYSGRHLPYFVITLSALAIAIGAVARPATRQWVPVEAGALGMVAVFGVLLAFVLSEVHLWAERATPISGLRVLGFKRTPVLLLIVLWLLTSVVLDGNGTHDVRLTGAPTTPLAATTPLDLKAEFDAWTAANCADAGSPGKPAPLIIVGTSGGGIRAAYWTAEILDSLTSVPAMGPEAGCAHTVPASSRLFAASGVSGGSLGLVSYVSRLRTSGPASVSVSAPASTATTPTSTATSTARWYQHGLGDDYLSPALSWGLFVDLPNSLIGLPVPDRARILEESWEHSQPALGKLRLDDLYRRALPEEQASGSWLPLLFLNGTQEESGCRFAASPIALNVPASADGSPDHDPLACRSLQGNPQLRTETLSNLTDYVCEGQDVRLSTAALLSARFAFVSPSGHLRRCGKPGAAAEYTYIVDGGYAERTGGRTALDVLNRLKPLIADHNAAVTAKGSGRIITPMYVQLENGYETVATAVPGAQPAEAQVPTNTIAAVRNAVEWSTQQAVRQAVGANAYQRLSTVPGPGVQAPLGWVLSPFARNELVDQMARLTATTNGPAGTPWNVVSAAFSGNWPHP
ncbi:MAG: hypothetical protein HOV83_14045 [Catenulispora sp.]|nr:hypothetical protein [Catenulispora sp.]